MKKILITVLIATLTFFVKPSVIFAQGADIDLELSPAVLFLSIKPGEKKLHTITLRHNSDNPLRITPTLVDFAPDGETGNPILSNTTQVDFISITTPGITWDKSFVLEPKKNQQIVFSINPDEHLPEKEFPLTFLFKAETAQTQQSNSGALSSAIVGSNLIVHLNSDNMNSGEIQVEQIKSAKIIDSFRPINYQVLLKNLGNNAIPISGYVRLLDWQNKELQKFEFVPDIILGQSSRLARYSLSTDKEDDLTNLSAQFSFKPQFAIGPYTIEVVINDPLRNVNQSYMIKTHVFAFPISIIITIFFVLNTYLAYRYLVARD